MPRNGNEKKSWGRLLLRLFAVYVVFCLLMFAVQRSLLFHSSHRTSETPLTAWSRSGVTIGYCREVDTPKAVWLMLHGNAGQAAGRGYVLDHISGDEALYVLEYPGFGLRDGNPSQSSIDAAAQQAYRYLRTQYPDTPVCVIGESLGSGPASMLATLEQPPDKIVLITPYDSLQRVAANRYFFLPVSLLMLDQWDNVKALRNYAGDVDIFAAESDTVIPIRHAKTLCESCRKVRLELVPGGHNDWSRCEGVKISY